MDDGQAEVLINVLKDILHELRRHNDNAKDRTDGIEESIREVGQTIADGLKALDLLVPKE